MFCWESNLNITKVCQELRSNIHCILYFLKVGMLLYLRAKFQVPRVFLAEFMLEWNNIFSMLNEKSPA